MRLSILICTVKTRSHLFSKLYREFQRQAQGKPVEILFECDNKEISVGKKRQILLERAKGDFIVYFDDDDYPARNFVDLVLNALSYPDIDCVGVNCTMTTNGKKKQTCCHRLLYKVWEDKKDGWDYVRNVSHRNPVLRSKALQIGFQDIRYGEDKIYSDAISKILTKEFYIQEPLFHYAYDNRENHLTKFGFKR